jgi:hypothetical protein
MEIIYRADDGTEFYDESDCERYEEIQRLSEMKLTSRFWDRKGHPMVIEDLAETVENAYYAELTTDEEAAFIDVYVYDKVGCCIFEDIEHAKAGRYYFDSYHEVWKNIEELNKKYRDVLAIFGEGK